MWLASKKETAIVCNSHSMMREPFNPKGAPTDQFLSTPVAQAIKTSSPSMVNKNVIGNCSQDMEELKIPIRSLIQIPSWTVNKKNLK